MLKARGEEPTSESVTPPALLPGPTTLLVAAGGTKEEEEHKNKETTESGEEQLDEDNNKIKRRAESAEDKAAKIARLKSGFRICKPQGTFIWPKMAQDVVQLDDHIVVPTPSSASSSSTTSFHKAIIPRHVPKPSSPVKPLAERRPVSSSTLTHVTMSFSPFLSPPLLASKITFTDNPPLINLNEAPPSYDSSFCGTLTYQPSLAPMEPHCPIAEKMEETEKEMRHYELQNEKEKEKENSSSSSSPQLSDRNGWWSLAMAGSGLLSEAAEHII